MAFAKWLVEIRLKEWMPDLPGGKRIVAFEEVVAVDEYYARHAGYKMFATRCNYEPALRRKLTSLNITKDDIYAADAVNID